MNDSPLDIKPLEKRESLAEQLVPQLIQLVQSGELKPGDKLPGQRELADMLGVARPTLRESLRALQLLGILDIHHGGGVYVSEISPDTLLGPLHLFVSFDKHSLRTVLEARKVIEGAVLANVATKTDDELIQKLQANLDKLALAIKENGENETLQLEALSAEFRAAIEAAVDNPILTRSLKSLGILSSASRLKLQSGGCNTQLLKNHQHIVQALVDKSPAAAQQALEAHIDYLLEVCETI